MSHQLESRGKKPILLRWVEKARDVVQLGSVYGEIAHILSDLRDEFLDDEELNAHVVWNSGIVDECVVLTWASTDKTWKSAYNKRISITFNALKSQISIRLGGDFSDDLGFNSVIDIASSGNREADLEELQQLIGNVLEAQNEGDTPEEYDCDLWYEVQTGLKIRGAQ